MFVVDLLLMISGSVNPISFGGCGPIWKCHLRVSGFSCWWFQPLWKILVQIGIFPKQGWKYKICETTTQFLVLLESGLCVIWQIPPSLASQLVPWKGGGLAKGSRIKNLESFCWWKKSCTSWLVVYSLPHYLQGFIHLNWCGISSINSFTFIFSLLKIADFKRCVGLPERYLR